MLFCFLQWYVREEPTLSYNELSFTLPKNSETLQDTIALLLGNPSIPNCDLMAPMQYKPSDHIMG
jgi:hypothetical protein